MSTVKADNFTWKSGQAGGLTGTNVTGDQIVYGVAKAWVNFSGVTSITTRASFNMSSITRNTTADYSYSYATAFADANYSYVGSCTAAQTPQGGVIFNLNYTAAGVDTAPTTSTSRVSSQVYNAFYDVKYINTIFIR